MTDRGEWSARIKRGPGGLGSIAIAAFAGMELGVVGGNCTFQR